MTKQTDVDKIMFELDGTENKSKLGANAILAVSLAVCKAGAAQKGVPLYKHIADLSGNDKVILPVPVNAFLCTVFLFCFHFTLCFFPMYLNKTYRLILFTYPI